ncbi:MAG: hypothetical protein R3B54_11635 [Bdellovibrionota bacterium]
MIPEMLVDNKFSLKKKFEDGREIIYISGNIDEDARFDEVRKDQPLIFDMRGIVGVNSCGVRSWVNFMRDHKSQPVTFRHCSPAVVHQMNMVPSFKGHAQVLSLYVPYACVHCDSEDRVFVDLVKGAKKAPAKIPCKNCKVGKMEIDGDEQQYFAFAA